MWGLGNTLHQGGVPQTPEVSQAEINAITSRQETSWHGTTMPAPGADRRGRSYRNSRAYPGKAHKPRTQNFADAMHVAPRKYVGRRFRASWEDDSYGEGVIIDYDANTGWWRGRYDDDVEWQAARVIACPYGESEMVVTLSPPRPPGPS